MGLPSRALIVSPRYDEAPAGAGELGELPPQAAESSDNMMKGAVKRKGMPAVVQALCCPGILRLHAFGAITGQGDYKIAGGDHECEKFVSVS